MKCRHCNIELQDGAEFCHKCGYPQTLNPTTHYEAGRATALADLAKFGGKIITLLTLFLTLGALLGAGTLIVNSVDNAVDDRLKNYEEKILDQIIKLRETLKESESVGSNLSKLQEDIQHQQAKLIEKQNQVDKQYDSISSALDDKNVNKILSKAAYDYYNIKSLKLSLKYIYKDGKAAKYIDSGILAKASVGLRTTNESNDETEVATFFSLPNIGINDEQGNRVAVLVPYQIVPFYWQQMGLRRIDENSNLSAIVIQITFDNQLLTDAQIEEIKMSLVEQYNDLKEIKVTIYINDIALEPLTVDLELSEETIDEDLYYHNKLFSFIKRIDDLNIDSLRQRYDAALLK